MPRRDLGVIWDRRIDPNRVFDLELPLNQVDEDYRTSDGP